MSSLLLLNVVTNRLWPPSTTTMPCTTENGGCSKAKQNQHQFEWCRHQDERLAYNNERALLFSSDCTALLIFSDCKSYLWVRRSRRVAFGSSISYRAPVWLFGGRVPSNAMTSSRERTSAESKSSKLLHRELTGGLRRPPLVATHQRPRADSR